MSTFTIHHADENYPFHMLDTSIPRYNNNNEVVSKIRYLDKGDESPVLISLPPGYIIKSASPHPNVLNSTPFTNVNSSINSCHLEYSVHEHGMLMFFNNLIEFGVNRIDNRKQQWVSLCPMISSIQKSKLREMFVNPVKQFNNASQKCRITFILPLTSGGKDVDVLIYNADEVLIANGMSLFYNALSTSSAQSTTTGRAHLLVSLQTISIHPDSRKFHFNFEIVQVMVEELPPAIKSTPLLLLRRTNQQTLPSATSSPQPKTIKEEEPIPKNEDPEPLNLLYPTTDESEEEEEPGSDLYIKEEEEDTTQNQKEADSPSFHEIDVDQAPQSEDLLLHASTMDEDEDENEDDEEDGAHDQENDIKINEEVTELDTRNILLDEACGGLEDALLDFNQVDLEEYVEPEEEILPSSQAGDLKKYNKADDPMQIHMEFRNVALEPVMKQLGIKNSLMLYEFQPLCSAW